MLFRCVVAGIYLCIPVLMVLGQAPSSLPPSPDHSSLKYPLTEREGPWLIHIGSFRGDEALEFAHRFAEETRNKHRLLTFIYSMEEADAKRDREQLRQLQINMIGTDKVAESGEKQKLKTVRVIKEYSVFVGNFLDMEKARAESVRIKEFPAPTSIPSFGVHLYDEPNAKAKTDPQGSEFGGLFKLRSTTKSEEGKRLKDSMGNPYRQAFVVKNPILTKPQDALVRQKAQPQFDQVLKELNANEKHSIYTCPKSWTLVVAKFAPVEEIDSSLRTNVVQTGNKTSVAGQYTLAQAAQTAREVAELLRDGGKGYDAYVFHTRQYSLVTVGAFESRYDPNMEQAWNILKQFAESQKTGPFSLLMKPPLPMQIPGR